MKGVLVATLSLDTDVAADVLVSMVAVALESVLVASPPSDGQNLGGATTRQLGCRAQSFTRTLVPDLWDCSFLGRCTPRG